ncbi:MAG TPA: SDR family oxidoreductase [bacterium]|nr:SDR family oxidoreductase [bacterium]
MLLNKIVLITGGNMGIGLATAKYFAENKITVLYTYFEDQNNNEQISVELKKMGAPEVEGFFLDLQDDENIKKIAWIIKEKYGQIDYLINNAALKFNALLENQSFNMINSQLRVNLEGLIKLTKEFLPFIKEVIINIASALALEGAKKDLTIYCASKYGVRGFTKSLAREYPQLKIYTLNPSLTATRMGHFQGMMPEKTAEIVFNTAMGKYRVKSGADINVRDYKYNKFIKFFLPIWRLIKKMIKF